MFLLRHQQDTELLTNKTTDNILQWAFLSPFYTIFNILHLKIISSSERESRQSNKESGRKWKKALLLLSVVSFLLFLSSLAVKNSKSKHLLVHEALLLLLALLFFFQSPHFLGVAKSVYLLAQCLQGHKGNFFLTTHPFYSRSCFISLRLPFTMMLFILGSQLNRT